jgi:topoisomerase-4 subunit A
MPVLDMRLRSLRRLEEEALRTERTKLTEEQADLTALVGDEARQWRVVSNQIKDVRTHFAKTDSPPYRLGLAPEVDIDINEILIEKEPVTVICSEKGWIRAMKGHLGFRR